MTVPDDKQALRERVLALRAARTPEADAAAAAAINAHVLGHPAFLAAQSIAAFVGIAGEPDTRPILEAVLQGGRTLWLPRVFDGRAGKTQLVVVSTLDELEPRAFGLLEPRVAPNQRTATAITDALQIDLVLVPGLAFGRDGARLGHGPGHYDRLLQPVRDATTPVRIGLCFGDFVDPFGVNIPIDDHDVPMHAVVTDAEVIVCD